MTCCEPVKAYRDINGTLHNTKELCLSNNKRINNSRDKQILKEKMYAELSWCLGEGPTGGRWTPRGGHARHIIDDFLENLLHRGYDIIRVRDYE
jgi:hypothetical protein